MLIPQCPTLTEDCIDSPRSRFVIEPLEPGFGYTLGNSLRRTLLSSIPGAVVASICISGVLHKLTAILGVKEDVSDIILNIKGLVLSSEFNEPATVYLRREGADTVTAVDIERPASVEIHNLDHHIVTLNESGRLGIGMIVERGRGYVPATPNSGGEIGRIPIDQIYSPVLKVSCKVETVRVKQRTDFDKLIIDVETKNSITARGAMASTDKILVELFGPARELNEATKGIRIGPSPREAEDVAAHQTPIEGLDFSTRPYNRPKREEIHTVGELAARIEPGLLDIRNFGDKLTNEVKEKLAELGLTLKDFSNSFGPAAVAGLDAASGDDADWTDGANAGYDEWFTDVTSLKRGDIYAHP